MLHKELFESILDGYHGLFDIFSPHELCGRPVAAYCYFMSKNERYVLIKRAVIWSAESFEHVVIIEVPKLEEEGVLEMVGFLSQLEKTLIKPDRNHMYSYITVLLLCQNIEQSAKKRLKRIRFTKNYRFTWHGYSSGRIIAINVSEGEVVANAAGKPMISYFKKKLSALV